MQQEDVVEAEVEALSVAAEVVAEAGVNFLLLAEEVPKDLQ